MNDPNVKAWTFTCNDPNHPNSKEDAIFTCEANLEGLSFLPGNFSPITEYGTHDDKLIACRWNILQPNQLYFLHANEHQRVTLQFGHSSHPMKTDMEKLIGDTPAAAVRTIQSPPVAIQARAFFP